MEGQLIIHGKPTEGELLYVSMFNGFEEKVYSDFFSSSSKPTVSPCYVFEIRRWKGILYSVYSYYHDGKDKYGSGNGYCVVSLIIREHFTLEYGKMMATLYRIYESILKDELNIIDDTHKYLVSSLRDFIAPSIVEKLYADISSRFEWKIIPPSYNTPKATEASACVNTEDATNLHINEVLKKAGKINISKKFPPIHEQQRLQDEAIKRKVLLNGNKADQSHNYVSEENGNIFETDMLMSRIDKAEAKIIRNVECLLSTYIPADKDGIFTGSDSEDSSMHGTNQFSLAKLSHWLTLVNCFLLLVFLFYTCRSNNGSDSEFYQGIDRDSTKVELSKIAQSRIESLTEECEYFRKIIEIFKQNQWPKIGIDNMANNQLKLGNTGTLTLDFNDVVYPEDKLKGEFIIIEGDKLAKLNKNVITTVSPGYVIVGYIQEDAILASTKIEIIK